MLDLLASGQNKLSDPILMKWALRRFQQAQTLGSERCHDMERAWFHDISLRHWIDSDEWTAAMDQFVIQLGLWWETPPGRVWRSRSQPVPDGAMPPA